MKYRDDVIGHELDLDLSQLRVMACFWQIAVVYDLNTCTCRRDFFLPFFYIVCVPVCVCAMIACFRDPFLDMDEPFSDVGINRLLLHLLPLLWRNHLVRKKSTSSIIRHIKRRLDFIIDLQV